MKQEDAADAKSVLSAAPQNKEFVTPYTLVKEEKPDVYGVDENMGAKSEVSDSDSEQDEQGVENPSMDIRVRSYHVSLKRAS